MSLVLCPLSSYSSALQLGLCMTAAAQLWLLDWGCTVSRVLSDPTRSCWHTLLARQLRKTAEREVQDATQAQASWLADAGYEGLAVGWQPSQVTCCRAQAGRLRKTAAREVQGPTSALEHMQPFRMSSCLPLTTLWACHLS